MKPGVLIIIAIVVVIGGILLWQNFLADKGTPNVAPTTDTDTTSSTQNTDTTTDKPPDKTPPTRTPELPSVTPKTKSRVVIIRNNKVWQDDGKISDLQMQRTLNAALNELFETESYKTALRKVISRNDKVGLKVNTYLGEKNNATSPELVDALSGFLQRIGVDENNIIIWDHTQNELEKAGFKVNRSVLGIQCLATLTHRIKRRSKPLMGFDKKVVQVGNTLTRLSSILSKHTTVTINMPVLKTHKFTENTGVNAAILNMYRAIEFTKDNKKELWGDEADPGAALVYNIPEIRNKTKLIICDALKPLYNGGPMDDKRYHERYNGVIVGMDPVAVDSVCQSVLQKIRDKKNKDWPKLQTNYLQTAQKHNLGVSHPSWIEIIEVDLD